MKRYTVFLHAMKICLDCCCKDLFMIVFSLFIVRSVRTSVISMNLWSTYSWTVEHLMRMSRFSDTDSFVLEARHAGKYVLPPSPSPGCSRVLVFYPGPLFSLPSHVNSKIWTCNSPWVSILYGKEDTRYVTLIICQELGILLDKWQKTIEISKSSCVL